MKGKRESPLPGWFESAMLVLAFFAWRDSQWIDFGWNLACAAIHWWLRSIRWSYTQRPFAEWYPPPRWPTYALIGTRSAWLAVLAAAAIIQINA